MLRSWRSIANTPIAFPRLARGIADLRPFREGDLVLLRRNNDRSAPPILTRPLKPGRRVESHKGVIRHDDIIGKSVRDIVSALPKRRRSGDDADGDAKQKPGQDFRLYEVKLDEYVRLTRRLVTPIYPADARLIVDLLDLHPEDLHRNDDEERLEILEAGTGHGALTLYLARAICGGNRTSPHTLTEDMREGGYDMTWKFDQRAVVHTIEISEKYSQHAEEVVKGFKDGLYSPHVDFHVGDVHDWVTNALAEREGKPFLSHAFLDLPNADRKLAAVTKALRVDGTLIVFNPSITQIMDAANKVKNDNISLELENVIELGVNGGSGGREWDVRPVKPRAMQKVQEREVDGQTDEDRQSEGELEGEREEEQVAVDTAKSNAREGWSMVCRPKVGERVVGGGFLGVWKKQRRAVES